MDRKYRAAGMMRLERRQLLQAMAAAVPAWAFARTNAWADDPLPAPAVSDSSRRTRVLRIALRTAPGRQFPSSTEVSVNQVRGWTKLRRAANGQIYEIDVGKPGTYSVRVIAAGHRT